LLAICYGQQTLHQQLGGRVVTSDQKEFGRAFIEIVSPRFVRRPLECRRKASGVDEPRRPGREPRAGFEVVASSEGAPFAIATNEDAKRYSLMFHPEVVHTPDGGKLLANFVRHVCGCSGEWTMGAFRDAKIADIREQVGRAG
jgi:GMP synthase (glutamine-hydrolysing)